MFFAIFPDNKPKDIPHSGACEKDLPAQRHGEVLDGLLQPQGDDLIAGMHEEAGGNKTHHRAHHAYDHGRDRQCDKNRLILRRYHAECQLPGQLFYDKVFQKGLLFSHANLTGELAYAGSPVAR